MSCVTLVKAALSRVLFGAHALVTVWRVVSQEGDTYWKLGIGIIILFCDGLHALCNRKVFLSIVSQISEFPNHIETIINNMILHFLIQELILVHFVVYNGVCNVTCFRILSDIYDITSNTY